MSHDILKLSKKLLYDSSGPSIDIAKDLGLSDYVLNLIKSNLYSTIGIKYESGRVIIDASHVGGIKVVKFEDETSDSYKSFCEDILNIDLEEKFNCSVSVIIEGVRSRIYALMPPLTRFPVITISTTKEPPAHLEGQTVSSETLKKIVMGNFLVVGGSGSGKTYLMNYLINRYTDNDKKIAIIEEFGELIPPNDLTISIIVPPPKPEETHLLRFVTEQSNLMRLHSIFVGEIKGAEALPFILNLASGTKGGSTIHGESAKLGLSRLSAMCTLANNNMSTETINEFIAKSLDYIITMKDRRIENIFKVRDTVHRGNFTLEELDS